MNTGKYIRGRTREPISLILVGMAVGVAVGIAYGLFLSTIMGNTPIGMAIGIAVGIGTGMSLGAGLEHMRNSGERDARGKLRIWILLLLGLFLLGLFTISLASSAGTVCTAGFPAEP